MIIIIYFMSHMASSCDIASGIFSSLRIAHYAINQVQQEEQEAFQQDGDATRQEPIKISRVYVVESFNLVHSRELSNAPKNVASSSGLAQNKRNRYRNRMWKRILFLLRPLKSPWCTTSSLSDQETLSNTDSHWDIGSCVSVAGGIPSILRMQRPNGNLEWRANEIGMIILMSRP